MSIELIDATKWREDHEFAIYSNGARDKRMLWSPAEPPLGIKANWPYLFKLSRDVFPEQFWCEIIAYLVGLKMGIEVPAAFPATYTNSEDVVENGALMEWFYDENQQAFTHASDFFFALNPEFESESGKHHNLNDLVRICRRFSLNGKFDKSKQGWEIWLPNMLLFDAFIGNTDRHQENWGFVFTGQPEGSPHKLLINLAPLFDNGTSLGCEMKMDKVANWNHIRLEKYINCGCHHLRHQRTNTRERVGHLESIQILTGNENVKKILQKSFSFDIHELIVDIESLSLIKCLTPLSLDRLNWIKRLILRRYQKMSLVLEMRILEKIIEPSRLWLTWQPLSGGSRYLVGKIDRDREAYTFTYLSETDDFHVAESKGFLGHPAFPLKDVVHTGNVLEPFLRRLPPSKRKDYPVYMKNHFLPYPFVRSDFALLGYTGAKSPADGFCLIPDFGGVQEAEYLAEVAGTRYQKELELADVAVGDSVELIHESDNEYDPNAIAIIHSAGRLGYINKVHCQALLPKIRRNKVLATVAKKNGTPERPLIYVLLEFFD
ncbi:HIRAN domain-containing protein [Raoultella planticola]